MDENLNQPYVQEPLPEAPTYVNVQAEAIDKYRQLVVHYFDNQMNYDIMMLQGEDKNRMFQMLHDYADVLEKILHNGIPILEYIQDKSWAAANKNPHTGINWEYSCPIIAEYKIWKESRVQNTEETVQQS